MGFRKPDVPYQSSPPSSGSFNLGARIFNTTPTAGGYTGWICTTSGIACGNVWASSFAYTKGQCIYSGNYVHMAQNNGTTGTSTPSFPSTIGQTVVDGGVTWQNLGVLAVFKAYGTVAT
jgi:hypothetical protein